MNRKNINMRQKEVILAHMEVDKTLFAARCNSAEGRKMYKFKWIALMNELNAVEDGPNKTVAEWQRIWAHLKNKIKGKASAIKSHARGTGGGPPKPPLNDFEERVANLIGEDAIAGLPVEEAGWNLQQEFVGEEVAGTSFKEEVAGTSFEEEVFPIHLVEVNDEFNYEVLPTETTPLSSRASTPTSYPEDIEPPKKRAKTINERLETLKKFTTIQNDQTKILGEIKESIEKSRENTNNILLRIANGIETANANFESANAIFERIAVSLEKK